MGMRVRIGPFSVSSRGRVGVHAGPVSVYGGGRRRRNSGGSGAGAGCLGLLIALAVIVFVVMWPLSLVGHAVGLTPSWHQLMNRDHVWEHQHYPLVGLRYLGAAGIVLLALGAVLVPLVILAGKRQDERDRMAALQAAERERLAAAEEAERKRLAKEQAAELDRRAREAHETWLAAPPPRLNLPGRFTQNWIAKNVPELHPGQVPVLMEELKRRGWTDDDIRSRVLQYVPFRSSGIQPGQLFDSSGHA
jgi:hypothetical protein